MSEVIEHSELEPADVLLYRGHGVLARLIRLFDGTDFNHVGICLGQGDVGEALGQGVVRQTLLESIRGRERVDVRRLTADVNTMDPVITRARQILDEGERYAYEQLLLLAFLALTRRIKVTPVLRVLVRQILDRAAAWVAECLDGNREPMICSEFVYRCYDEALASPEDVYSLEVNPVPLPADRATRGAIRGDAGGGQGQGVHPESLLAWRLSPAVRPWQNPAGARRGTRAATPATDAELEALAQDYFEELHGRSPRRPRRPTDDRQLRESIDGFAEAIHRVQRLRAAEGRAVRVPRTALESLARTAADFVTPGDIFHTPSLFTLGSLSLAAGTRSSRPSGGGSATGRAARKKSQRRSRS